MTNTFELYDARALLARTPALLQAWLPGLPDSWLNCTEGGATWSPRDVVAHLTDLEDTDWMPRVRLIQESTDPMEFAPIDRDGFKLSLEGQGVEQLCRLFAERRARSLAELDRYRLRPQDLARLGRHPSFGEVTLEQLLATWVVHDLTHIAQIARTLARRYDRAVGPWRDYLGVLTR
jgi:hypothetical protein